MSNRHTWAENSLFPDKGEGEEGKEGRKRKQTEERQGFPGRDSERQQMMTLNRH